MPKAERMLKVNKLGIVHLLWWLPVEDEIISTSLVDSVVDKSVCTLCVVVLWLTVVEAVLVLADVVVLLLISVVSMESVVSVVPTASVVSVEFISLEG